MQVLQDGKLKRVNYTFSAYQLPIQNILSFSRWKGEQWLWNCGSWLLKLGFQPCSQEARNHSRTSPPVILPCWGFTSSFPSLPWHKIALFICKLWEEGTLEDLIPHRLPSPPTGLLTTGLSRLSVLPSRWLSALESIWEGKEKGSECLFDSSLPDHGSPGLRATDGAFGIGLDGHRSAWRLEGTGGGLSLEGQSPGVQGRGRLWGRPSVPMECGLSGGGGGGRSLSVGGIGKGLSLWRVPGAAWKTEECKILLNKGIPATKHKKERGRWQKGEFLFYLFLQSISKDVEITRHISTS